MTDRPLHREPSDHANGRRRRLELLFAEYVERLNAGEDIDPQEIIEKHSELAADLLRELDTYESLQAVGVASGAEGQLGTLGDYTLRRQIGRGGMGVVYEAWQNSVDRQVALKVLPAGVAADERALQRFVRDLNTLYRGEAALHQRDCDSAGFEWIDANDYEQSVICFLRKGRDPQEQVVVALNFTPVPRHNYRIGVTQGGRWDEVFNSDAPLYGGSGQGNLGGVDAAPVGWHGRPYMLNVILPPLGLVMFKRQGATP